MDSLLQITTETLDRIRLLRNNVLDLSVAIDDLDAELAPRLADRAHLDSLLREAQAELTMLVQRAA